MSFFDQVRVKSWLAQGEGQVDVSADVGLSFISKEKLGLVVFLSVVASLFLVFVSAFLQRRVFEDWIPLPGMGLLWFNTCVLFVSSFALHLAGRAARSNRAIGLKVGLLIAGVFASVFLVGQLFAWQQLSDWGYFVASNPANSFFYMITGLHGLHLIGGMIAWIRTALKAYTSQTPAEVRVSVELCAIYWHFLLVVWLVFFALMFL